MSKRADRPGRREFLKQASASALVLAAHRHLAWATSASEATPSNDTGNPARIRQLRLRTAAPLAEMKAFYHQRLGLPILRDAPAELTIGGGATPITFVPAGRELGMPFYHFAFNIPENKLRLARKWQLERTELLPVFPYQRDPAFPDDVIHFRNWNAHSIFFLDPAGNVVEYIARHDLDNAANGPFTAKDILYASEIAFVADDVGAVGAGIKAHFDLPQYGRSGEGFMAIGDEHGLLLVFGRGRNISLGYDPPKLAEVFPAEAGIRGRTATRYAIPDLPYAISSSGA